MSDPQTTGLSPERDVMQDEWCCLACFARFKFGKLRMGPTGLMCPVCRSENTAAADGRTYHADQPQTTNRPLGRWHRWWLADFKQAYLNRRPNSSGGICVEGYEGTVQGRALAGLMQRGLIAYVVAFEGGATILRITDKGLAA